MSTKTTVKDAKACLNGLLEKLSQFNDSDEFVMELTNNCGGSYICKIDDFGVSRGNDDKCYCTNF